VSWEIDIHGGKPLLVLEVSPESLGEAFVEKSTFFLLLIPLGNGMVPPLP
jgi:hypothetical protein